MAHAFALDILANGMAGAREELPKGIDDGDVQVKKTLQEIVGQQMRKSESVGFPGLAAVRAKRISNRRSAIQAVSRRLFHHLQR